MSKTHASKVVSAVVLQFVPLQDSGASALDSPFHSTTEQPQKTKSTEPTQTCVANVSIMLILDFISGAIALITRDMSIFTAR